MAPRLTARLQKRYPGFELDVELALGDGVTALVGPSGAGKTTIIRCLAGLDRPDGGFVALGDERWFDSASGVSAPVQGRRVGFVFQDSALFPHLTVRRNVEYAAAPGEPVAELLRRFDLLPLRDRYPRQLSAGQQQRAALARALAAEPRLLLLDEPFASLDTHLKERLYGEFLDLRQRAGVPAILVTHDLAEATRLAAGMVVLAGGRVLQCGSPRDVLFRPASPEVAQLAGIRNVFTGRLDGAGQLWWGERRLAVDRRGAAPAGPLSWCVRSDQVELPASAAGAGPGDNSVFGLVRDVHLAGSAYRMVVAVPGCGQLEVLVPVAPADALGLVPGREVLLRIPPGAIHLLGPDEASPIARDPAYITQATGVPAPDPLS